MKTIYLDETGYTGENLADQAQPVFVLASHDFTESESQELKDRYFGNVRAVELKHTSLSKRPAQQQMVIDFLRDIEQNQERVKIFLAHKPYALTAKMVDIVIEPAAYSDRLDLYNRGVNLALVNLLFYLIPSFSDEDFFAELLSRFQELIRTKTPEAYNTFFEPLFIDFKPKELDDLIEWLRVGHLVLGYDGMIPHIPNNSLDISFTMALNLMSNWRAEIEGPIRLIHDASSNMSRQKNIWEALVDPDLEPAVIGYDRRKLAFPIAVTETVFESSRNWAGLQIADVLAGATARAAHWLIKGKDPHDTYGQSLSFVANWTFTNMIWPEAKFTPEELGTTGENALDPIEYMATIARKASD